MALGMTLVISLVGDSMIKGLIAGAFGIFLGTIGMDPTTGIERFSYGIPTLLDGLSFVSVSVGLFAISEVSRDGRTLLPSLPSISIRYRTCCRTGRTGSDRFFRSSGGAPSASSPAPCPGRAPPWPPCWPTPRRKRSPNTRKNSARESSKGSRPPRAPTTPPPAAP